MKTIVYPGSFDPVTLGHLQIIKRGAALADELIVAVLRNSGKQNVFTVQERTDMLAACTRAIPNVRIMSFDGLLGDFVRQQNAACILRGLRSVADYEYEAPFAAYYNNIGIETLLLLSEPEYGYISSSAVREIGSYGGDISAMVPKEITEIIRQRLTK